MTSGVDGAHIGTSGFSYASWKPGFYPAGTPQRQFLRWAAETPAGFRFAVKMPHPNRAAAFTERVRVLGGKLGPVRIVVQQARDERLLARLLESLDPALEWALDFRHESWAGVETGHAAVVNALEGAASFRYLRFRDPPYTEAQLVDWAGRLRPLLDAGVRVYAYFRHEDEPLAPRYALRLRELLGGRGGC